MKKETEENVVSIRSIVNYTLASILLVVVLFEGGYIFIQNQTLRSEASKIKSSIELTKGETKRLKELQSSKAEIGLLERQRIEKRYGQQDLLGVQTGKIEILDKVKKKGTRFTYFVVKINFKARTLDALKDYVALIYIDPKVYRIKNVSKNSLTMIIKEV